METVARVYASVETAGVHRASSIKVAEAAKIIENTQRDLNIALMNELALIFDKLGIDTNDVLEAAGTKWNFLKFKPGLVGGHCIGVDPYYLTHMTKRIRYRPHVILSGRRINENMAAFIAKKTEEEMKKAGHTLKGSRITVLGLTFKEDCPDLRNSKVIDLVKHLQKSGARVQVHDPVADAAEAKRKYGIPLVSLDEAGKASAVVVAVAHSEFRAFEAADLKKLLNGKPLLIDVKGIYDPAKLRSAGIRVWRL